MPAPVTNAELAILKVLWRDAESTIRLIVDELYPDGGASAYATVQKLLSRMVDKSVVTRIDGTPLRFGAAVEREAMLRQQLRDTADALCEGSLTPLLTQLVRAADLSAADIEMLRQFIAHAGEGES